MPVLSAKLPRGILSIITLSQSPAEVRREFLFVIQSIIKTILDSCALRPETLLLGSLGMVHATECILGAGKQGGDL